MYNLKAYINTLSGEKRTIYVDAIQESVDDVKVVHINGVSRFPIDGEFGAGIEFEIPDMKSWMANTRHSELQFSGVPISVFNFYTYVFSAAVLGVFLIIFSIKERSQSTAGVSGLKHIFGYIAVMSVCLFANSFFKTKAAGFLDSAQLYPLNQGLALMLSSIMSAVLFNERLTFKCIIGLVLSFAGLIIINVL